MGGGGLEGRNECERAGLTEKVEVSQAANGPQPTSPPPGVLTSCPQQTPVLGT